MSSKVRDIYFEVRDGSLVSNIDIAKIAYIANGDHINPYNLDDVREYCCKLKGISKEIKPSIKVFLTHKEKIKAIMFYREKHPGMDIKHVKQIIDKFEEIMLYRNAHPGVRFIDAKQAIE